jgi:2-amino-4-hydroxy-6-hydroxymethyldihydropteridine diphosphokinase
MWHSRNTFARVNTAYLLLGSNIEPRLAYLKRALALLQEDMVILKSSSVYETEAWQMPAGTLAFLNVVIKIETACTISELLKATQHIEQACLRTEKSQNTSRTLDIDILLFNEDTVSTTELIVPHPRLHLRKFTLIPLCEIAAEKRHPQLQKTFAELLTQCTDICEVRKYDAAL